MSKKKLMVASYLVEIPVLAEGARKAKELADEYVAEMVKQAPSFAAVCFKQIAPPSEMTKLDCKNMQKLGVKTNMHNKSAVVEGDRAFETPLEELAANGATKA